MKVAADRYAGEPAPVEDGGDALAATAAAHVAHAEHATTEEDKFIFCDRQN